MGDTELERHAKYFAHYPAKVLAAFHSYHWENPQIYIEFERLAIQMREAGQKRYSAQAIVYKMRWDNDLKTTGKPFKITNDFTSIYARLLCFDRPEFEGFFKMHRQGKHVKSGELPNYI